MKKYIKLKLTSMAVKLLIILGLTFSMTNVMSQDRLKKAHDSILGQEIKIGQPVPDLTFFNVLNQSYKTIKLSDFKGKAVIIDFWATWCGPCVEGIPKLMKLQNEYKSDLQVIGVSSENKTTVLTFLSKLEKNGILNYPICSEVDSGNRIDNIMLHRYFPHRGIPHYIWIDKNGILKAVTESSAISIENIKSLITGKKLNVVLKDDYPGLRIKEIPKPIQVMRSIYASYDSVSLSGFNYSSILMKADNGNKIMANTTFPSKTYKNRRIQAINFMAINLFRLAYADTLAFEKRNLFPMNRIEYKLRSPSVLDELTEIGQHTTLYCYDLIIPTNNRKRLFNLMKQDLERYFNVTGNVISKEMDVYSIIVADSSRIKESTSDDSSIDKSMLWIRLKNQPIVVLVDILNEANQGPGMPIFYDSTGIRYNIDLEVNSSLKNIDDLRSSFQKVGFDLIKSKQVVSVLQLEELPD